MEAAAGRNSPIGSRSPRCRARELDVAARAALAVGEVAVEDAGVRIRLRERRREEEGHHAAAERF